MTSSFSVTVASDSLPLSAAKAPESPSRVHGTPQKKPMKSQLERFHDAEEFFLCPHYTEMLENSMETGFANMKWASGFTMLHFAAKKNNLALIKYLLNPDNKVEADLHSIDDFGKKPIDYACPFKKDSVYPYLEGAMSLKAAPKCEKEEKYQTVKKLMAQGKLPKKLTNMNYDELADYMPENKKKKKAAALAALDIENIIESADIADGAAPPGKKQDSSLSTYEVEQQIPADYKKGLKVVQGGWDKYEGKWPKSQTLLHWAARNGNEEICKYCIFILGADPHEECGAGKTAIDHARLKKHRKLAKSLIKKFKA